MTTVESMMLSVCFGCCMGYFLGNVGFLIAEGIHRIKEKRRKKKEVNKE